MMMMLTAEVATAEQKRRSYDCFLTNTNTNTKKAKTGGGNSIPTKEKKDKIGERVAALQQLVSPFGKTDTASVLQEATGYIRFLQDQLQVLSSPYLRPSITGKVQETEYYSLRSRGLCLMPVASTLRIARSNGADLWAPINTSKHP